MIKVNNLSYSIGRKKILNNINLEFQPGEFSMILGPNGSGKSTLLKILSGEDKTSSATVHYNGENIFLKRKESLAKARAFMSQQPELSFPLTVEEVVMMGRYPHFTFNPSRHDQEICMEVIQLLKLNSFVKRNYLTLSGGEKQRVQFARVLSQIWNPDPNDYRYLFLDEPLTSLDINYQQEFLSIVRSLIDLRTVVVAVMHDINLATQFADTLWFLKNGEVAAFGKPKNILSEEMIEEVFDVKTSIIKNPITGTPLMFYC